MASSEIYFKEVVVITTIPTNKVNLGKAILKDIEQKTFPKDTTFYIVCGFHTKVLQTYLVTLYTQQPPVFSQSFLKKTTKSRS